MQGQIVVMVTKAVSEMFDKGGIADQAIKFNGFPALEKEEAAFNTQSMRSNPLTYIADPLAPVANVMQTEILTLSAATLTIRELGQFFNADETIS